MATDTFSHADAYRGMALIRRFEEQILDLGREGFIAGSIHLCLGQEAIPVGTLAALQPQDRVLSTYRGHGWALACGSDPTALMAEIAQRGAGVNGGRAGSPLLSDPDHGFLGENSIVGAGVPIAGGVALASQYQGTDRVVVTSIGDGAMNQGSTTEGMIFAAARKLPVIFLCENNGWAEMTPTAAVTRGEDLVDRGKGLHIDSRVVDGGDPFAVRAAVASAAEACRRGEGPVLLECKTIRLSGHYNKDVQHYRPKEDAEAARAGDPLALLVHAAVEDGTLSEDDIDTIDEDVYTTIDRIADQVRQMPEPSTDDVAEHVYAPEQDADFEDTAASEEPSKELTYLRAINLALRTEMENRPEVAIWGEDVGFAGGIFGVTRGLHKEFGDSRIFDTPIAEAAILGAAVGAAMEGMRPVVEIMWADFVFVALDQVINQAANVRYVNRSRLSAPLTIRMQQGVTPGSCAQHSQSIEAILAHIPGIKVGLPATAQDAYAMTRAAVGDPDPTVLIEHRSLYQEAGPVTAGGRVESAAGARMHRDGTDVAIITWGAMLGTALTAADALAADGIEATVLDLRWLRPLDDEAIARVVAATSGRVLVVHEANLSGGFGAEVSARVTERHFGTLRGPVHRIGLDELRMPSAPALQAAVLPGAEDIVDAARKLAALTPA
ncbi:alpha-ketoacid dehydrogenase subunit alpha/beta [Rhodococcoides corynebacterioides]|uniref:alpha-ketoacid dehydrogenase subunit alpha/beta n=1 Tax=Rhodococcoides corynebacterioides TaxID=53972 RepID=UPI001C9B3355|nr:alpha-ketoacid dehydrogenase subunit alpha/beta [Rhodococcus corynebacterioides]MBY6362485.1 transketolase [Rhodococcus corynebacterioides]